MKLSKTVRRIQESKEEGRELHRAARDIGHSLLRYKRWEDAMDLDDLRSEIACAPLDGVTDYVKGYRAALREILAAYVASLPCDTTPFTEPTG